MNLADYQVKWSHVRVFNTHYKVATQCVVNDDLIGTAYCSVNDNFCKETGRKLSLKRAITNLPRTERTKIWKAYHDR